MATPEDLRAFDAKKGEVHMGKLLFMSLDLIASYIFYVYNKQDVCKQNWACCTPFHISSFL